MMMMMMMIVTIDDDVGIFIFLNNYYLVLPKSNVKKIIQSSAFTSTELNPSLNSIITILNNYNQDPVKFASFEVNNSVVVTVIHIYRSYTYILLCL